MRICDFLTQMERIAPSELALPFDNVGLLVDCKSKDIKRVLVALDASMPVVREAIEKNADLVLTHHPIIFDPIKRILRSDGKCAALYELIAHGIGVYSAHTNLDAVQGGVNDVLVKMLELRDVEAVAPENIGRVGNLKNETTLKDLACTVNSLLNAHCKVAPANFARDFDSVNINRVALMGGAGGGDINLMAKTGAQVYITGELKHNQAIEASTIGLSVIAAGHYETEVVVLKNIIKSLQTSSFGVEYIMTTCEQTSLADI